MKISLRYARHAGVAALFVAAALLGTLSGVLFAYSDDLPAVSALDDYSPNTITRVLGKDDQLVGEFAVERRVVLHYNDIPERLRQAILSAEDADFFSHFGLSPTGIMRTVVKNALAGRKAGGASTLTQQLARKLFLTDDKTPERKIKEALLAIAIEKRYSKDQILELYFNQIYFGHGAYGVEAAAHTYFQKSVEELTLPEVALLAGLPRAPNYYSPMID